jgi:hypothetical protein
MAGGPASRCQDFVPRYEGGRSICDDAPPPAALAVATKPSLPLHIVETVVSETGGKRAGVVRGRLPGGWCNHVRCPNRVAACW